MQLATWTSAVTIRSLFLINAAVVVLAFGLTKRGANVDLPLRPFPLAVAIMMALLVLVVNVVHPLQAADPYHLQRMTLIERLGTLAYDPFSTDPKVNVLGWTYELVLADVDQIPVIGHALAPGWFVRIW